MNDTVCDPAASLDADVLDLPFDQYQRYRDVKEVVARLRATGGRLRILDIGGGEGHHCPALDFFRDEQVLVVDRQAVRSPRFVRASGLDLPFPDEAFDVAFSCDTLEHIAPSDRECFVREMFRVARQFVVLIAPFHSRLTELAEQTVQEFHVAELGTPNGALLEHGENGLPDAAETAGLLARLAADFRVFPSGNIHNWLVMNAVVFTFASVAGELCRAANRIYNSGFYSQDHTEPSYRLCFVAARTHAGASRLDSLQRLPWGASVRTAPRDGSTSGPGDFRTLRSWREGLDDLKRLIREKDVHIGNIETQLSSLHATLADRETLLRQAEQRAARLERRVEEQRASAERLEAHARALDDLARSQQETLRHIQSSVAWSLLERFWTWNAKAFPAGTRRRRLYESAKRGAGRLAAGDRAGELIHLICDEPRPGDRVADAVAVRGWCVAPSGIDTVEVLVDGRPLGRALYGQLRADIVRDFPGYPDSEHSGFLFMWDSRDFADGLHELTVGAVSRDGRRRQVAVPVVLDQSLAKARYRQWIEVNEPTRSELEEMANEAKRFTYRPLISVVAPVYRTPIELLREAVESVRVQAYDHWQLCLADDGSADPELTALLREYAAADPRISVTRLATNSGIAAATNAALALTRGEFVALLDNDDTLAPDALYRVVELLQLHRDADLVYSDEDKLDAAGERFEPFFKPDWSPDLLLSMNYVCHFLVVRRSLVEAVGGLRSEFDGSQDYDLVLRVVERTRRIRHLPHVLYHWRACASSTAMSPKAKPQAHVAAQSAIADYLQRNNIPARVEPGCGTGRWRVRYEVRDAPKVAIILPTGGRLELLRPCLEGIFGKTDYRNYEIVLIDNSKSDAVHGYVQSLRSPAIAYVDQRGRPFNYSALNNLAVRQTAAPLLLFLNDDTAVVDAEWLTALVEHGQRPTVGVVGAKLIYPFGMIQHAGVVMGLWENTGHAFRNLPGDSTAYFTFPQVVRNCSAVTAACMMTKRDLFLRLGGFDETRLAVAFQDVDYCLRVCEAGFYVVYTPYCTLVHHESVTKDEKLGDPREVRYMQTRWAEVIAHDPYYSPHLTRKAEDYRLRTE